MAPRLQAILRANIAWKENTVEKLTPAPHRRRGEEVSEADILRVYDRVIRFGNLPKLPNGWFVIQLDSGHYQAVDGTHESCITVNRFHARKWAFQMAKTYKVKP